MDFTNIIRYFLLNIDFFMKLGLILLYGLFATLVSMPYVMKQAVKRGYTGKDMYKHGDVHIPALGGVAVFIGLIIALSLSVFMFNKEFLGNVFIFYFVVIIYFLYGVLDDMFHFEARYDKILILTILSLPLSVLISKTAITLPFLGSIYLGPFYAWVIVPIFVMVTANMFNIHAGFNGLTTGLSILVLVSALIKSIMLYGVGNVMYIMPILGGLIVLHFFNRYPAKTFVGNSGDFMIGGAVGAFLMINGLFKFGLVILFPHIINFLMDTWTMHVKKHPAVKFGTVRADGTVKPPKVIVNKSIIYWLTGNFRMTEKTATNISLAFTAVCCVIGLVFF